MRMKRYTCGLIGTNGVKTKVFHHHDEAALVDFVEGLGHVNFDGHKPMLFW